MDLVGAYPHASIRTEVTPKDAEVYVDGYYAGRVSQFDGVLQGLQVAPGQRAIVRLGGEAALALRGLRAQDHRDPLLAGFRVQHQVRGRGFVIGDVHQRSRQQRAKRRAADLSGPRS